MVRFGWGGVFGIRHRFLISGILGKKQKIEFQDFDRGEKRVGEIEKTVCFGRRICKPFWESFPRKI